MKKVMFALAAILVAGMVQAAALNWSIANVYEPGSTTDKAAGGSVMLFVTSYSASGITPAVQTTTISAITALLDAGDFAGAAALSAANKTLGNTGGISGATGLSGFTTGDTLSAFAVIFNSDNSKYYLAVDAANNQTLSKTWSNATSAQTLAWANQTTASQNATWSSVGGVPEPTSGLLLLIGGAMLALRRKQHA